MKAVLQCFISVRILWFHSTHLHSGCFQVLGLFGVAFDDADAARLLALALQVGIHCRRKLGAQHPVVQRDINVRARGVLCASLRSYLAACLIGSDNLFSCPLLALMHTIGDPALLIDSCLGLQGKSGGRLKADRLTKQCRCHTSNDIFWESLVEPCIDRTSTVTSTTNTPA